MSGVQSFSLPDGSVAVGKMSGQKRGRPSSSKIEELNEENKSKLTTLQAIVKVGLKSQMTKEQVMALVKDDVGDFDDSLRTIYNHIKSKMVAESEVLTKKKDEYDEIIETLKPLTDDEEAYLSSLRKMAKKELVRQLLFSKVVDAAVNYLIVLNEQTPQYQQLEGLHEILTMMEVDSLNSIKNTSFLKAKDEPATQDYF